ncbi:MAG TPA: ThiF family adenylyltransferase [Nitrospiria bacterium]|nr:ThiF family adenylyltransferase [Nitrospiria bacterium]
MIPPVTLSLTGAQHDRIRHFLYPGDDNEAVVLLLCGRRAAERRHRLLVRDIHEIPYRACSVRSSSRVTWPPEIIEPLLERAADQQLSVIKIHSHPCGYADFSATDNIGDRQLLPMIQGWVEADIPHGSAVMLPDGQMFGRVLSPGCTFNPISVINVVGDNLCFWYSDTSTTEVPGFAASYAQAFGAGTTERLRRLSVAVIGCSGTGGPVVEQLYRNGVGDLLLVDDDYIEERNVNRIPNSTMDDAHRKRYKVDVLADAVKRAGLGTKVSVLRKSLWHPEVVEAVAQCDVVFGCMDTIDGRFLLNALATYYTLPYFDIGIRLDAVPNGADKGRIREVCGTIHYIQPDRSSLMSRGLFSLRQVAEQGLRRNDPTAYIQQVRDGYISGVDEHRPAVNTVNTLAASLAVHEFLARLHPYREEPNNVYASVTFSLASMELLSEAEQPHCQILKDCVGVGDSEPLLGLTELARKHFG